MRHARNNTKHGPSPRDPNVRGHVYLIVNDQNARRLKVGFTLKDPLDRARDLVSTGTNGTFVVIYEAYVNGPKSVEDDVHEQLSDYRREGEWFEIDADTAVTTIRRCAGAIHFESTEARWPPTQATPQPFVMEMVAEARRAAAARREQEALAREASRLEDERRREVESRRASEQQEHAAARRPPERATQQSEARRGWNAASVLFGTAAAMSLVAVIALMGSEASRTPLSVPPATPTSARPLATTLAPELDSKRREVSRLEDAAAEKRSRLAEAESQLQRARHSVETLPTTLRALEAARAEHERDIRDSERFLLANEAQYREFKANHPDFRAEARLQAEQAEERFIAKLVGRFFAEEDAIASQTGRTMSPQGIENNITRIRQEAERDAIRVYNAAADKVMARLYADQRKLAGLVETSKQRLEAAREAKAAADAAPSALAQQLKRSQQELAEARALIATLTKECRVAETASAAARDDLRKAEESTRGRAFSQGQVVPAKSIAPPPPSSRGARPRKT
jgi:hypothetical protein